MLASRSPGCPDLPLPSRAGGRPGRLADSDACRACPTAASAAAGAGRRPAPTAAHGPDACGELMDAYDPALVEPAASRGW